MDTFSSFKYIRPDLEQITETFNQALGTFREADSFERQRQALKDVNVLRKSFESMRDLVYVRFTLDTRDEFYVKEKAWFDSKGPIYDGLISKMYAAILDARFGVQYH